MSTVFDQDGRRVVAATRSVQSRVDGRHAHERRIGVEAVVPTAVGHETGRSAGSVRGIERRVGGTHDYWCFLLYRFQSNMVSL